MKTGYGTLPRLLLLSAIVALTSIDLSIVISCEAAVQQGEITSMLSLLQTSRKSSVNIMPSKDLADENTVSKDTQLEEKSRNRNEKCKCGRRASRRLRREIKDVSFRDCYTTG